MFEEIKKGMMPLPYQIENINKKRSYLKNENSGAEKFNN